MTSVYCSAPAGTINRPQTEPPRLLDRLRFALRAEHCDYRTEQAYVHWVRRFILHHGKRHPNEMGGPEIGEFLTHLALAGHDRAGVARP
ncbi:MAG: phage integrase N-terminal SAM-like domain-containing protein [Planctomycetes bacterium]|nr:phage integrase N-terminal SAM-like domain-containing protein [Planctomycetota bacterium]